MTIDPRTQLPVGQIGTCKGWAICRSVERLPFGSHRLTVTAVHPNGMTTKWRDFIFKWATPEAIHDIAQEMESEIRHLVCEIEELEASWKA